MELLIEAISVSSAFFIFCWALILSCKKPRKMLVQLVDSSNVVSFQKGRDNRIQENLQMFLDAEEALSNNEHEKYIALRIKALESAKENLRFVGSKSKKAC